MGRVFYSGNANSQRLKAGLAEANIAASDGGRVFTCDMRLGLKTADMPVVIFGGGPSLREEQEDGRSRMEHINERDDCVKVLAGSALSLLDSDKASAPGQYLSRGAQVFVENTVYDPESHAGYYDGSTEGQPGFKDVPDDLVVLLASYNGDEAFEKFGNADPISVNAYVPGVEYDNGGDVIGLGSTAPSAALASMAAMGFTKFEFPGVDGASPQLVKLGAELSTLVGGFGAAAELSELESEQRYQVYEIAAKYAEITPEDALTVYVGNDKIATLPRGQWNLIQEINTIVQETDADFEFTFFGETVIADHFVRGQEITLINDPAGLIEPGVKLAGNASFDGGAFDVDERRNDGV